MNRTTIEQKIAKLQKDLQKAIKADNAIFRRLSKKKARVAIAQDVLKLLESGYFKSTRGTYYEKAGDGEACEVCAIGSMFVACAQRGAADLDEVVEGYADDAPDRMRETLAKWFSVEELHTIEAAFEGWSPEYDDRDAGSSATTDARAAATEATENYTYGLNAEKALRKIMKNIIANDGEFVVEA